MKTYYLLLFSIGLISCSHTRQDSDNFMGSWQITDAKYQNVYAMDEKAVESLIGQKIVITQDCIIFPDGLAGKCCFGKYQVDSIDQKSSIVSFECASGGYTEKLVLLEHGEMEYEVDGVRFITKKLTD